MKERLQKILARAGHASRRAAEELIVSGRVRVNGRIVTELGVSADPRHDRIDLDGKRVVREPLVYLLFHKPRGMVATMKDPEGRPAVGEVVEKIGVRVVPVGRLDFHTSGALLLTNDGELTDALLHPKRNVPKVYVAKLRGSLDVKELDLLRNGVVLDDGEKTRPASAFVLREESGSTWIEITLTEGRNRQIHRMGDAIGHPVLRLARLSFAGIDTEGVRPGEWRPLDARELERLVRDWVTPRREENDQKGRGAGRAKPAPREREAAEPPRAAPTVRGPARGARATRGVGDDAAQGRGGPPRGRDDERGAAPRGRSGPPRGGDDERGAAPRGRVGPRGRQDYRDGPPGRGGPPRSRDDDRVAAPRGRGGPPRGRDDDRVAAPRGRGGPPRGRDDDRVAAPRGRGGPPRGRDDDRVAAPRGRGGPPRGRDDDRVAAPRGRGGPPRGRDDDRSAPRPSPARDARDSPRGPKRGASSARAPDAKRSDKRERGAPVDRSKRGR